MRRILVENARRKRRMRHGGGHERRELDEVEIAAPEIKHDLLALDDALTALEEQDPTKAELVKLRFFAGLTIEQVAQALEISTSTADRHWAYARAWLFRRLGEAPGE
jgi:RNA polymerase sigma factor (TIGR02999 family)